MKDNARHVPDSIPELRPALSRFTAPSPRVQTVAEKSVQNAYKMRPNFTMQIFNMLITNYLQL
jgi:hypothetical protein